ncbi:MAG: polysaccharide pyruvyl transferase family protein [Bacteroidales bacterium]|nr:polysaccharide pyruvyl transferase family protein [Bacteroidales bacterium]
MNILIINQPLGNRGDESAHKALVRALLNLREDISIRVLFIGSEETYSIQQFAITDKRVQYINLHPFLRFSKVSEGALKKPLHKLLWRIHPFMQQIKSQYIWSDLVLCAPGGICMGGFQNWSHLQMLELAKHYHKPLAYYGRSFGPFPTDDKLQRRFKAISYDMLHYFSFLSIRDKITEQLADAIGVSYVSTVDTAFLDKPDIKIPYEVNMMLSGKKYMVFVPNYLLWHPAYAGRFGVESLVELYSKMIREVWAYDVNLSIVMLPQTFGNNTMMDDIHLFRMIAEKLNDPRVIVIPDCFSSDIQQQIIKNSEFVIGARYHSIVFSINQNVPFIALSYEHKIAGLLSSLGREDSMIDFTSTMLSEEGKEECLAQVKDLLPHIKADICTTKKAEQLAQNGFDKFVERFNLKK